MQLRAMYLTSFKLSNSMYISIYYVNLIIYIIVLALEEQYYFSNFWLLLNKNYENRRIKIKVQANLI